MYFDITHNIEVNKKLIKIVGLNCATYWAELSCILRKVYNKDKYDEDTGYFQLDRRYIEDQICLTLEEQYQCDTILIKLGVMMQDDTDETRSTIKLDASKIFCMIAESDEDQVKKIAKNIKVTSEDKANAKRLSKALTAEEREQARANKKAGLIAGRCNKAHSLIGHAEFNDLYDAWINMVYAGGKYLMDADITKFHENIWNHSHDPVTYRSIMQICIDNHWINSAWAVDRFKKQYSAVTNISAPQKVATSFGSQEF